MRVRGELEPSLDRALEALDESVGGAGRRGLTSGLWDRLAGAGGRVTIGSGGAGLWPSGPL